jgi:hypothetical protein
MRNRRRHRSQSVQQLRLAIDCMPVATREAMLDGVRSNARIIAGAYVDADGGVCPMLAAHRCGGRTDFLSFAKSWDRFTRAARMRAASPRELAILVAQLEHSLSSSVGLELDRAIQEHRELRGRRMRLRRRFLAGSDPRGEIVARRSRGEQPRRASGDNPARQTDRRLASPVSSRG